MPRRTDLKTIMVIGSGPIVIGQACEFDYSGTQACKALRSLGYRVVLLNSNPATIMTDPATADATYIEPLTVDAARQVIEIEKPDALLPTLGGQTALNLAMELVEAGVLEEHDVELIGADAEAIATAENGEPLHDGQRIGIWCTEGSIVGVLDGQIVIDSSDRSFDRFNAVNLVWGSATPGDFVEYDDLAVRVPE